MARQEEEREDLLREATALVERVELEATGHSEPIVAGFRRDGAASFFFGDEVVYQFTATAELRRGFLHGKLYKADRGRLVELTRQRTAEAVNLVRHELSPAETARFLADARSQLQKLHLILTKGLFRILGQVPSDGYVADRVRDWLGALPETLPLADSPRLR